MVAAIVSIALMTLDHRGHGLEPVRSALSAVVYPLQYLVSAPVTVSAWIYDRFSTRRSFMDENQGLNAEHLVLKARLQKLNALAAENMRLRALLDSSSKLDERVLITELLAVDLDPYTHQVLINKGEHYGIYTGQPVLDATGVMGQTVHVGPLSSSVMLITDPSHAIPVQVIRNGLRSIAVGTGRINELELPYLPNNADIQEGDLVVTSGLGGRFPPGYPVGVVARVEIDPGRPFALVTATPSAQLERSRELLLVWPESHKSLAPPSLAETEEQEGS
jgi:rod shape-determining protein MreC